MLLEVDGDTGVAACRLRGGAGGGVIGWMFTVLSQSFELRFGEMRDGKLSVFVHWARLRTILAVIGARARVVGSAAMMTIVAGSAHTQTASQLMSPGASTKRACSNRLAGGDERGHANPIQLSSLLYLVISWPRARLTT